jgi:hypothetical protein
MQTSKFSFAGWLEDAFVLLLQLTVVVVFFAIAIWLWPQGLWRMQLSGIAPEHVVRAVASIMFLLVGITSMYIVVVEPFVRGYRELRSERGT